MSCNIPNEARYAMIEMIKIDLGIVGDAYNQRLEQYITTACAKIAEEGVVLDFSMPEDLQLIVTYAAWMWRRRDDMSAMPRMIRYALNNRLFSQKMREAGT